MKQRNILFGCIVAGGLLLVGCSEQSEAPSQSEALAEIVNEVRAELKPQVGAFSKYQTVTEYIMDIANRWVNEAKSSESTLVVVNDALVYADYFEEEIAKMGLKEDFDKLQSLGREIIDKNDEYEGNGERWDNFRNQIGEILVQIKGTYVAKKTNPEDDGRLAHLKEQTVEHGEYSSLENFVYDLLDGMSKGSKMRRMYYGDEVEPHLANVSIAYTNYFETEITELGLNKDFDQLQLLADNVIQNYGEVGYEEHFEAFDYKLGDINSKMVEKTRFDDMSSWVAASVELLSEPLGKFDENTKIATWNARKVAYSFPNQVISKKGLDSEEGEVQSKVFLLMSEISITHYVADRAKDYEDIWAKYEELKQFTEEVEKYYQ